MADHTLWERGDPGLPDGLADRNGDVVLAMCQICGQVEANLEDTCPGYRWPEGAVALCFDETGSSAWLAPHHGFWGLAGNPKAPMPEGHDWRVPILRPTAPVQMILHCPACALQHIDAPDERTPGWANRPHKSHLCHGCGHIWRPSDVATDGVAATQTRGSADSAPVAPRPGRAIGLGQFRAFLRQTLEYIEDWAETDTEDGNIDRLGDEAVRVLALIDGQAATFNGDVLPADLVLEIWPPQPGFQLSMPRGVKLTHKPTGTVVTCDTERSQHANRDRALEMLRAKLRPTKGEGVGGE